MTRTQVLCLHIPCHRKSEVPPIVRKQDGSFVVDGRMTLDVAACELGLLLPDVPAGVETLDSYVTVTHPHRELVEDREQLH